MGLNFLLKSNSAELWIGVQRIEAELRKKQWKEKGKGKGILKLTMFGR